MHIDRAAAETNITPLDMIRRHVTAHRRIVHTSAHYPFPSTTPHSNGVRCGVKAALYYDLKPIGNGGNTQERSANYHLDETILISANEDSQQCECTFVTVQPHGDSGVFTE